MFLEEKVLEAAHIITKKSGLHIGTAAITAHPQSVGPCLYQDCDGQWKKIRGINDGGAILVRPDNFVLWRSIDPSKGDYEELRRDLQMVFNI